MTRILGIVTALFAVATGVWHLPWAPAIVSGTLTLAWAIYSAPLAAYDVWRDERAARIAAENSLSNQSPATLRAAAFGLAHEIRAWLRSLPDDLSPTEEEHAIQYGFEGSYHARVSAIWDRFDVARFPDKMMPLSWYFRDRGMNRKTMEFLASDLDIFAKQLATDFLAE